MTSNSQYVQNYTTVHNRSHARAEAARSAGGQHREPKGGHKHHTTR